MFFQFNTENVVEVIYSYPSTFLLYDNSLAVITSSTLEHNLILEEAYMLRCSELLSGTFSKQIVLKVTADDVVIWEEVQDFKRATKDRHCVAHTRYDCAGCIYRHCFNL